jgi:hypothetical protein
MEVRLMGSFVSIVHENFDDLAASYLMVCIAESEYHVGYGNDRASFGVSWDWTRSSELGVGLGLESFPSFRKSYDLADILRFQGATAAANEIAVLRVEFGEDFREPITKLANLTKAYTKFFLTGDEEACKSMAEFMNQRNAEYNAQLSARSAKIRALYEEANTAWESQDYRRVVEIYGGIKYPLPPFARERLAIAEEALKEEHSS